MSRRTAARPAMTAGEQDSGLVRSEEELDISVTTREAGVVRVRKVLDQRHVEQVASRGVEHAQVEQGPPDEVDSGLVETLPDGSVSIPVFEEQLVVEKRLVVRERIIVRKHTVFDEHRVEADLRRERVEIDPDTEVRSRVARDGPPPRRRRPSAGTGSAASRAKKPASGGNPRSRSKPVPEDGATPAPARRSRRSRGA
ncbi:MAG: YsnF/AvaK domain-containing protein [Actinomycetota bacterium]|nr:YsnF/AvaK domain-containing protein [Actinomycetota bacterium]